MIATCNLLISGSLQQSILAMSQATTVCIVIGFSFSDFVIFMGCFLVGTHLL